MTRYEFRYVPFRGSTFPIIPVQLKTLARTWVATSALVDSGASVSLFDSDVGRSLGLKIHSGRKIGPTGIGGSISAYVHKVVLKIGDEEIEAGVAFIVGRRVPMNLLGRASVFKRFLITFDEKRGRTVLETYEESARGS